MERTNNFVINLSEDSIVTADNDFWQAELLVLGRSEGKKDTTLFCKEINKSLKDVPIKIEGKQISSIYIKMRFADNKYADLDSVFKMYDLMQCPSIYLPIRRILPQVYEYIGHVFFDVGGNKISVQDAIVILHDKIQRTDYNGNFRFILDDSIKSNDALYIVRNNFNLCEEKNLMADGFFQNEFEIFATDSIIRFESMCEALDSIKYEQWIYRTAKKINPRGSLLDYADGHKDRLVLFAKQNGDTAKNQRVVIGYYYYLSDYKKMKAIGHPYYAYHLLHGLVNSRISDGLQPFVFESYDIVGNRQQINGNILENGSLQGTIYYNDIQIATFGNEKQHGKK